MSLRILLADDHALFRDALRMTLAGEADMVVVAEAGSGEAVAALVALHSPDVVCMDLSMPGMDGVQATQLLLASHPGVKVIGLSAHVDEESARDMLRAGASGYVVKMHAGSELAPAIRAVAMGQVYISPELDL